MHLLEDIRAYKKNDPAARSAIEVMLLYNGLHATIDYRIAHWFYRHRCFFIARAISQWSKMWTGIEIHPGATIGRRLVIDHGTGIVIGETAEIRGRLPALSGRNARRHGQGYRQAPSDTRQQRHGRLRRKGAWPVPRWRQRPHCGKRRSTARGAEGATVVGVPGRIVRLCGDKLDHIHTPDPVMLEIEELKRRMALLEEQINDTKKET